MRAALGVMSVASPGVRGFVCESVLIGVQCGARSGGRGLPAMEQLY